jgi:hypothetical protein
LEGGVSPLEVSPSVAESSFDEFPIFPERIEVEVELNPTF